MGDLAHVAEEATALGDGDGSGDVTPGGPVIAELPLTQADRHVVVVEAVLVVTEPALVAAGPGVLLVLVLEVPTLERGGQFWVLSPVSHLSGLEPVRADQLETVILVRLTDLRLPSLVAGGGVFLSEVADVGAGLGGGGRGGGEGGAGVVGVAVGGVTGADSALHAVRRVVWVILGPAVGLVTDADVRLGEVAALEGGIVTREPDQTLVIILPVHRQTEGLVDVADLGGHVVVGLVLPHEAVEALQAAAGRGGVGGGGSAVRLVAHLVIVTQTEGPVMTGVVPAVLALLPAAGLVVLPVVVTEKLSPVLRTISLCLT